MSNFTLESEAFDSGGVIPRKYGYKNGNRSPPLKISGVPENTSSLVLIMDDPDAMDVDGQEDLLIDVDEVEEIIAGEMGVRDYFIRL